MPRAFSEKERQLIESKLIAAGKSLINKVGLRLLVVDDIAREAGISKGSFYTFFPSREDFILSVFESWEAEYRGALVRQVTEGSGTAQERIERFLVGTFEILAREPGLAKLGLKDIQTIIERLPPQRLAAHQAADSRVLAETFSLWVESGIIGADLVMAFQGLIPALFSIAMHREDFPPGSYAPAVKLIAEAIALRLTTRMQRTGEEI
jgi:AcrR family transcriptional regulator